MSPRRLWKQKEPTSDQGSLQVVCAAAWSPSLLSLVPNLFTSWIKPQGSPAPLKAQAFAPGLPLPRGLSLISQQMNPETSCKVSPGWLSLSPLPNLSATLCLGETAS